MVAVGSTVSFVTVFLLATLRSTVNAGRSFTPSRAFDRQLLGLDPSHSCKPTAWSRRIIPNYFLCPEQAAEFPLADVQAAVAYSKSGSTTFYSIFRRMAPMVGKRYLRSRGGLENQATACSDKCSKTKVLMQESVCRKGRSNIEISSEGRMPCPHSDCSRDECKYGLISQGEGTWGMHKHVNKNVLSYLFLMREPVSRAVSDYYYRLQHEP